jgi:Flp pilus assembly protein TadB
MIILMLNPGYLDPLFNDKLGHYFILAAITLQITGFFVIQKIVKMKF